MKYWNVWIDNVLMYKHVPGYTAKSIKHRFKSKHNGLIRVEEVKE